MQGQSLHCNKTVSMGDTEDFLKHIWCVLIVPLEIVAHGCSGVEGTALVLGFGLWPPLKAGWC